MKLEGNRNIQWWSIFNIHLEHLLPNLREVSKFDILCNSIINPNSGENDLVYPYHIFDRLLTLHFFSFFLKKILNVTYQYFA